MAIDVQMRKDANMLRMIIFLLINLNNKLIQILKYLLNSYNIYLI